NAGAGECFDDPVEHRPSHDLDHGLRELFGVMQEAHAAPRSDDDGAHQPSRSLVSTAWSSRVEVSPWVSRPAATSFKRRRMILPLRVLGSPSAKRMEAGRANLPMSLATCSESSCFMASLGSMPAFSVTKATSAWPVRSSGRPTAAASATAG